MLLAKIVHKFTILVNTGYKIMRDKFCYFFGKEKRLYDVLQSHNLSDVNAK